MSANRCEMGPEDDQHSHDYVLPEGRVMPNTVFVGGIDTKMDEIEIREFFSQFGSVKEVKIITDRTGVSKGYGFVSYYEDVDVQKIVDSQMIFRGKKLKLGPAIRKHSTCSYVHPRPVLLNTPVPQYNGIWNTPASEPYLHHAPLFAHYVQNYPYTNTTPVVFQHIPLPYQQPGYYQVTPQWPTGDHRSYVTPQAFVWNYGSEYDGTANETFHGDFNFNIQEQNGSPTLTSPQKKVDRSIQTIISCLLNGDGRLQRSFYAQEDYFKERRVHQYKRTRR